ncbi:MAG TPA: ATP-binding cassette domain-containing protein, partial [Ilumatobacteraceae bacterium]|nr:ATP-binding cassette domain-containing protein [Ilumatobacteraceae bacterium]
RNIGNIFQDYKLLLNKTVHENVAFALEVIGRPKHVIRQQVPAVMELVGLAGKQERFPHQLSGGEQQRLAIARALVHCWPTSPRATSTPARARASCGCSTGSTRRAPPW